MNQTQLVHEELAHRNLLPQTHLVDAGYVDAGLLVESRERYGVELLGPVSRNNQWQARSLEKAMICQDLKLILRQERPHARKDTRVSIGKKCVISMDIPSSTFALTRKRVASVLAARCVLVLKRSPGVCLFVLAREFLQLQRRRKQQETEAFQVTYAKRAGIEGTHSQAVRALGLRQCHSIGLQKASLQHSLIAAAVNLLRLDNFVTGEKMEKTRISHFAALAPKKAA
jgi:transposase